MFLSTAIRISAGFMLLSAGLHAEELAPLAGRSIVLGEMRGIAYYRPGDAGFEVVVTLAGGPEAKPVRFTTTLRPGQATVISTPGELGQSATIVAITRDGDRLLIGDRAIEVNTKQAVGELAR